MTCPLCDNRSRVLESRSADDGAAVRRRRQCTGCDHRFTTFERCIPALAIVRKRDGSRQPFDPGKLRDGLIRAAHKLPAAEGAVELIIDQVVAEAGANGELTSKRIGEICLLGLRDADEVAYLRFATVHKQIADADSIRAELRALDLDLALAAKPENFKDQSIRDDQHHDKVWST